MESRVADLERQVGVLTGKLQSMARAVAHVIAGVQESFKLDGPGYHAKTSRPEGTMPPQESGVPPYPYARTIVPGSLRLELLDAAAPPLATVQTLVARVAALEEAVESDRRTTVILYDSLMGQGASLIEIVRRLEKKIAAMEYILCYQTVDPVVANWDRFEILDTVNHLHEQMEGFLDREAKAEAAEAAHQEEVVRSCRRALDVLNARMKR